MASLTLSLSGKNSVLSADYFPPIKLDPNAEYVCGLIEFQTFNSIPNINPHNNRLHFLRNGEISVPFGFYRINKIYELIKEKYLKDFDVNGDNFLSYMIFDVGQMRHRRIDPDIPYQFISEKDVDALDYSDLAYIRGPDDLTIKDEDHLAFYALGDLKTKTPATLQCQYVGFVEIPTGTYEIEAITSELDKRLKTINEQFYIKIDVNKNTLMSSLKSNVLIDCDQKNSICTVLGFKPHGVLTPSIRHKSDEVVKISGLNTIRIECNTTSGSYANDSPNHAFHEFYPSVPVGYKIIEVPRNVIYLPLVTANIDNLTIRVVDQDNQLLDFRGEKLSLRLHIKKL